VQKPTQALQSVKGPGNTFDVNPKWAKTLPSLIYFSWNIYRDPPSTKKNSYQSWYLTTCCGHEVQKPTQALKSVKCPGNTFDVNPKWASPVPSLLYFSWDPPPSTKNLFNYQSWYLKPCCGLEVQKPTQALNSVKGSGTSFDSNPKCAKTLPSLIYFSWYIYRAPPPPQREKIFNYQSWYLTPCCGLEVQKPTQALQSAKGPGNTFDLNLKWARTLPSLIYFSWDIYRDPSSKLIFDTLLWGLYKYPMKNILRTAKFLPTWGLDQRHCPTLWVT
jgi:hypothetical protein